MHHCAFINELIDSQWLHEITRKPKLRTYYRILLFAINTIIYCICTIVLLSYCICNSEIKHNTLASRNETITRQ